MKQVFTTALIMLVAIVSHANHLNSDLLLSSSTKDAIVVTLDNETFNRPDFVFEFHDLSPGVHDLTVSRVVNNSHARRQVTRVIYRGSIFIPEASRISASVGRNSGLRITDVVPVFLASSCNNQLPVSWTPAVPAIVCPVPAPMDLHTFDQLMHSMESMAFESSRFQIARQAAATNYFTSGQVAVLLTKFTFESTRLDFAKLAYQRTLDKNRYFLVNTAFAFESSIDELNTFILYES
jgi:Domain of unknown function (DUF4476)